MRHRDLPLDRDSAGLFLPAIIGFMVFLAALAFAASMAVDNLLVHWRGAIEAAFSVQLPPVDGEDAAAVDSRRNRVLVALAAIPGIEGATLLTDADKARLLAPWLGPDAARLNLPLPDIIAVTTVPGNAIDMASVAAQLEAASPGAIIDDHGRWRDTMTSVTHAANLALLCLLLLVGLTAALTVVFVARAGLASHRRIIEVLHLIGAHDGYIAGQFQRHALTRGLFGGIVGAAAAAGVFLVAERWLPGLGADELALRPPQWASLSLLPIFAALLAMATARYTVLRSLRQIL